MEKDTYLTLDGFSYGDFKEKGSKFLAYCHPFHHEDQLAEIMATIKSDHPKASHYCYAYKLGTDSNRYRYNDDGEPTGTAGKPIFGQINSHVLTDILIVVVRYFGGTKLGVSGLINAYKQAAIEGLTNANIVQKYITTQYILRFTYADMGNILAVLKQLRIQILDKSFEADCTVKIEIKKSESATQLLNLKSLLLGVSVDQVDDDTEVDFCSIVTL